MFNACVRILLKLLELIGCIACLITKNLTDAEARRIAVRNQKYSREWSLLNNVTWSREGNAFASVTYGGYTLITSLLLISRCINAKSRPNITEKIFLTVGMIFFFTVGSLVYASLEQVPVDLHDNAIILGSLSYLVALLFLIDLADPLTSRVSNFTQTENYVFDTQSQNTVNTIATQNLTKNSNGFVDHSTRRPNVVTPSQSPEMENMPPNGYYFSGEQVDVVQTKTLPSPQKPVFAKILTPEKKKPIKEKVPSPSKLSYHQQALLKDNFEPIQLQHAYQNHYFLEDEPIYRSDSRSLHLIPHISLKRDQSKDEVERPLHSGFVAQAARMWDRKARHCPSLSRNKRREFSTVV